MSDEPEHTQDHGTLAAVTAQRDRLRRYILADRAVGRYRSPEAHLPRDERIYDPEEHRLLIEWREALRDVTEHGDLGDEA